MIKKVYLFVFVVFGMAILLGIFSFEVMYMMEQMRYRQDFYDPTGLILDREPVQAEDVDCFSVWEGWMPAQFCCHMERFMQVCGGKYALFSNTIYNTLFLCGKSYPVVNYDERYREIYRRYLGKDRISVTYLSDIFRTLIAIDYKASYIDIDFFMYKLPDENFMLQLDNWMDPDTMANGIFNLTKCEGLLDSFSVTLLEELDRRAQGGRDTHPMLLFTEHYRQYKETCDIRIFSWINEFSAIGVNFDLVFNQDLDYPITENYAIHISGANGYNDRVVKPGSWLYKLYDEYKCNMKFLDDAVKRLEANIPKEQ